MKRLIVELPDEEYENIITLTAVSLGRFPYKGIVMYALNAIRRAEIIDDKAADKEATTKIDLVVRQLREEAEMTLILGIFIGATIGYITAALMAAPNYSEIPTSSKDNLAVEEGPEINEVLNKIRAEIGKSKTEHEMQIAEKDIKAKLLISDIYCDIVNIINKNKRESEDKK